MNFEETSLALASVAAFGFTGSLHCLGMCGPLAAAACRTSGAAGSLSKQGMIVYALVRIASYGILGFAAGLLGAIVLKDGLSLKAQTLAIIFAVLMVLWAASDLIRGIYALRSGQTPTPLAHKLQKANSTQSISWLLSLPLPTSVALGAATAVLPCGFLAAAYLQAGILGHPLVSSSAMIVFAVVTSPALLAGAAASLSFQKFFPRYAPIIGSILLMTASLLLLVRTFPSAGSAHHHNHHHEPDTQGGHGVPDAP